MPASLSRYIFSRRVANNFDLKTFPKKTKWTPPGFHIPPPRQWYRRCCEEGHRHVSYYSLCAWMRL